MSLVVCCVAAVALVGLVKFTGDKEKELQTLVDMEDTKEGEGPDDTRTAQQQPDNTGVAVVMTEDPDSRAVSGSDVAVADGSGQNGGASSNGTAAAASPAGGVTAGGNDRRSTETDGSNVVMAEPDNGAGVLNYNGESKLVWPVQGNVLMEYSMDAPVYFATLDQYKRNPGMLIQSEEDTLVFAGADGQVTAVEETAQYGWTVTLDLGNDYTVTYGQLKDVAVETGAKVATGAVLGKVAAPSKYFSVEGDSIYMEMRRGNATLDPLDYLE